jgi:crossover junction endodeoxyribonuclease RusA
MTKLKVVFDWPDPRLFPNAKNRIGHWGWRPVANKAREDACIVACSQMSIKARQALIQGDDKIYGTVTFHQPDRRKRDDDGMIGAFKHARDGLADALQVDDYRFRFTYHFADEPVKGGRVEVQF